MTDDMEGKKKNGAPPIKWPEAIHEYELQDGENIEEVEMRLKATKETYSIWHPGQKGKGVPARFHR